MAAQPAPPCRRRSPSRTGRTSSRGREGGLKLIIELEKTAAVDSLPPSPCPLRPSVTPWPSRHKAPRREEEEEEEEEEEANQRSAEGRPYNMQVNRRTPPAPPPTTLQGRNGGRTEGRRGGRRRRRMAAANDVIYYGLIFRLPSEAARERASDVAGSGNASEWEAGGRRRRRRRSRYLAAEKGVHCTDLLTRCVFGGWLNIWLGGREDGRSVGCSVGCFGRLCFVNKFHLYHSSSL